MKFCRPNCGACCVEISISSPIPGHPNGKAAGIHCVNLQQDLNCSLYGQNNFPDICRKFMGDREMCGDTKEEAIIRIRRLEELTTC